MEEAVAHLLVTDLPKRQEQRAAYHEAGHALIAYNIGWQLKGVSIEENETSYGRIQRELPREVRGRIRRTLGAGVLGWLEGKKGIQRSTLEKILDRLRSGSRLEVQDLMLVLVGSAAVGLGGLVAQVLATEQIVTAAYGSRNDLEKAKHRIALAALNQSARCEFMTALLDDYISSTIQKQWGAVEALAQGLLAKEEKRLDGEEAAAIMEAALTRDGVVRECSWLETLTFGLGQTATEGSAGAIRTVERSHVRHGEPRRRSQEGSPAS